MAFNTINTAKIANLLRNGTSFFQTVADIYRPPMIRNKEKLFGYIKEKAETASKSKLAHQMRVAKEYYTLEISPPKIKIDPKKILSIDEVGQIVKDAELLKDCCKNGCFKFFTVKQVVLLILVAIEIVMWFFVGETIGKWHIVGYEV